MRVLSDELAGRVQTRDQGRPLRLREEILHMLDRRQEPLDDDQLAHALGRNRDYVNAVCRALAEEGLVERESGPKGKLVNSPPLSPEITPPTAPPRALSADQGEVRARPRSRHERGRRNVEAVIRSFDDNVFAFEASNAFPGPSRYFHERAIERRRANPTAQALLGDERFLEYVYAVLPSWGMHRLGRQPAKVGGYESMVESFRRLEGPIAELYDLRITDLTHDDASVVASTLWDILSTAEVSASRTRIVAGSKAMHHLLPDLLPPIDRQYTFTFFLAQKQVSFGERQAFLEWFPLFSEIGRRCRPEIEAAIERGEAMATGEAKVIDNAIIGFMRAQGVNPEPLGD